MCAIYSIKHFTTFYFKYEISLVFKFHLADNETCVGGREKCKYDCVCDCVYVCIPGRA